MEDQEIFPIDEIKKMSLFGKFLSLILVLTLVGAGTYYYQKKQDRNRAAQVQVSSDPYVGWKTYDNTKGGFSMKYSWDMQMLASDSTWEVGSGKNKLTVNVIKMAAEGKTAGLGPELDQVASDVEIKNAIQNKTKLLIPGIESDKVEVVTLGSTNYLMIFPGLAEGCFCWPVRFVTIKGDNFVEFSAHVSYKNDETLLSQADFDQKFAASKTQLLDELYGSDLRVALASFK